VNYKIRSDHGFVAVPMRDDDRTLYYRGSNADKVKRFRAVTQKKEGTRSDQQSIITNTYTYTHACTK
jgi:hypothetical protein